MSTISYIYWDDFSRFSYNFGTKLQFLGKSVCFENPLAPSSTNLYTWSSQTNYQSKRISPNLPLLRKGTRYSLSLNAELDLVSSLFVRIEFYNRFNESVGFELLKKDSIIFIYPKEAYTYTISLINAGCSDFTFHYLKLEEVTDSVIQEKNLSTEFTIEEHQDVLNLLLVEKKDSVYINKIESISQLQQKVELVSNPSLNSDSLILPELEKGLEDALKVFPDIKINVIAYGTQGNFAALYYAKKFPRITAYINDCFAPFGILLKSLPHLTAKQQIFLREVWDTRETSPNVKHYGLVSENSSLNLVSMILSGNEHLPYLTLLKKQDDNYDSL
ncbi:TPA: accessory Sec system protein Asp3 [Streptococcus agalactiae]